MSKKLTDKQQRFVEEYLVDLNATQAAIRSGYSKKTAAQTAARLLTNVKIQAVLEIGREELSRATKMSAAWVIDELRKRYDALVSADDQTGACRPLELIGKHFLTFPTKNIHTGMDDGPIITVDMSGKEACRLAAYFMQKDADRDEVQH